MAAMRGARRSAAVPLLAAAFFAASLSERNVLIRYCYIAGSALSLAAIEGSYRTQLYDMPAAERDLVVLSRGRIVGASLGIVYDEADQIDLTEARRSSAWGKRATQIGICDPWAARLVAFLLCFVLVLLLTSGPDNARGGTWSLDGFQRFSLVCCVGLPLATIMMLATSIGYSFPFVMLGLPVLLGLWGLAGLCAFASAVVAARKRAWLQAGLFVALGAFVGVALSDPTASARFAFFVSNGLNVTVLAPLYRFEISILPRAARDSVVFNRGGMIWASGGVVYDATDQIMLPEVLRTKDWLENATHNELSCDPQARHLWGHWYSASFSC